MYQLRRVIIITTILDHIDWTTVLEKIPKGKRKTHKDKDTTVYFFIFFNSTTSEKKSSEHIWTKKHRNRK